MNRELVLVEKFHLPFAAASIVLTAIHTRLVPPELAEWRDYGAGDRCVIDRHLGTGVAVDSAE